MQAFLVEFYENLKLEEKLEMIFPEFYIFSIMVEK